MLLRHAKSDWNAGSDSDHARPLNPRGRSASKTIGEFLRSIDQLPNQVICSTAVRTRETLTRLATAADWSPSVDHTDDLYDATVGDVLQTVQRVDGDPERLMLVGHEPTSSSLAAWLTGGSRLRFPTAALIRIDLPIASWSELQPGFGHVVWFVTPKLLARLGQRRVE